MHDLKIIPVLDTHIAQRPARNDLKVPLDRDAKRVEPKLVEHLRDADSADHSAMLAVDADTEAAVETH